MNTATKKMETADLSGLALDWAVAAASGLLGEVTQAINWVQLAHQRCGLPFTHGRVFSPSTDWCEAGPIIERANITIIRAYDEEEVDAKGFCTEKRIPQWFAECGSWIGNPTSTSYEGEHMAPTFMVGEAGGHYGTTPLIAAMRSFVAFKLGAVVEVPAPLVDAVSSPA